MIYLSWSITHLAIVILMWAALSALAIWKTKDSRKGIIVAAILWLLVMLYMAFDVGTRQQDLQRSSFDAIVPTEAVKKTERKTLTREDVNITFENAVKETE